MRYNDDDDVVLGPLVSLFCSRNQNLAVQKVKPTEMIVHPPTRCSHILCPTEQEAGRLDLDVSAIEALNCIGSNWIGLDWN